MFVQYLDSTAAAPVSPCITFLSKHSVEILLRQCGTNCLSAGLVFLGFLVFSFFKACHVASQTNIIPSSTEVESGRHESLLDKLPDSDRWKEQSGRSRRYLPVKMEELTQMV